MIEINLKLCVDKFNSRISKYISESGAHCARKKENHYLHLKSRYILRFKDLTNIGQLHSGRVQMKNKVHENLQN